MAARTPRTRKPASKSLPEIVAGGDRRASLEALRDHLASLLVTTERDHASIARQLTVVLRELDDLPSLQEDSKVDDLAQQRAARRAKAAGQ